MKQLHVYTNPNKPMETYYHVGEPTNIPNGLVETKGVINLIVDDVYLYVEKQFPLHPKEWFDNATEMENGFFKLDKPFLLDEDLVITDLLKGLNIDIKTEVIGNIDLKIELNADEDKSQGSYYVIDITVTSSDEIFKEFDNQETLTYTKVESGSDKYHARAGIKTTSEEAEKLAKLLINSVSAVNMNTDTFKRNEQPRRDRTKLRSDVFDNKDKQVKDSWLNNKSKNPFSFIDSIK